MESFITGGEAISSSAYSYNYGIPKNFVDKPVEFKSLNCTDEIGDPDSINKLNIYKKLFHFFMITGVCVFIIFFILAFANSDSSIYFFIGTVIFLPPAFIFKSLANTLFKNKLVDATLQNHYSNFVYNRTTQSVSPSLFSSFKKTNDDPDLIRGTDLRQLVKTLNIGGNQWNRGSVSDEIIAYENQTQFRFFDTFLEYEYSTGSGKSRKTHYIPIFRGQIYIFPSKVLYSCDRLYIPAKNGVTPAHLSDFYSLFTSFDYSPQRDPFIKSNGGRSGGVQSFLLNSAAPQSTNNDNQDNSGPHNPMIETPEFMECLLRLYMLLPGIQWGVRVLNGYFVLILMREKDVLEFNFSQNIVFTLDSLRSELTEMFSITSVISEYDETK